MPGQRLTREGLVSPLNKVAFGSQTKSGDILGPITISGARQLFLVEARYSGTLDERAQAALRIVRADEVPDPLSYTTRFSPEDAALARDAGWRADAEFASDEGIRAALFDTPIGLLSDPFALDGKLALAIVDERKTGAPDARTYARLTLDGYAAWFHGEKTAAKITRSDDPMPELASPTPTAARTLPPGPVMPTPQLPQVPGAQPTAVKTDQFGFPELP